MSQLSNGRRLLTSSGRASLGAPPWLLVQRQVGGSLEELLKLHQTMLEELRPRTQPERLLDDAAMAALADRSEREGLEFHLRRGLYEEVSPEEVAAQSARIAAKQAVPG